MAGVGGLEQARGLVDGIGRGLRRLQEGRGRLAGIPQAQQRQRQPPQGRGNLVGLAVGLEVVPVLRNRLCVGARRQPAVREGLLRGGGAGCTRLLADAALQQLGPLGHQTGKGDEETPVAQRQPPGVARREIPPLECLKPRLPHGIRLPPGGRDRGQLDPRLGAAVGRRGGIVRQKAEQTLRLGLAPAGPQDLRLQQAAQRHGRQGQIGHGQLRLPPQQRLGGGGIPRAQLRLCPFEQILGLDQPVGRQPVHLRERRARPGRVAHGHLCPRREAPQTGGVGLPQRDVRQVAELLQELLPASQVEQGTRLPEVENPVVPPGLDNLRMAGQDVQQIRRAPLLCQRLAEPGQRRHRLLRRPRAVLYKVARQVALRHVVEAVGQRRLRRRQFIRRRGRRAEGQPGQHRRAPTAPSRTCAGDAWLPGGLSVPADAHFQAQYYPLITRFPQPKSPIPARKRPVCEAGQAATTSGVPATTRPPPASPPSGPRSTM